ncbi:glycosyltransferase family 39 protein [Sphingobium sp. PNB]|uniref:ArnT family glycosyltransferase n=1 Tax=Sphingobium sp. PNB TaxID=863934 RepID=UPI001CA403D4|nr:glycosyltransferase family 39 protein [Sphingobium sp. PNB]MCB4860097.1 glycosyltransferase family 39 protein [Sphingobium sp. PNB]
MISCPARMEPRGATLPVAATAAALLWFGIAALATPFDHDESQYIAGAWFSSRLLIYRDFLYLQPPLHAWLFAPLALGFPGRMLVAMRLATAACALITLLLLHFAQRRAGISRASAALATAFIAATAAFQFTASVTRNDMLPTMLATLAMLLSVIALQAGGRRHWFGAGLFFGLAVAAKLNFIPLGAAVGGFALLARPRHAAWLALGALAGLAPMLVACALAPAAFFYGVVTFAASGPFAWYAANGAGDELSWGEKFGDLAKYLWRGPALLSLAAIIAHGWASRGRAGPPERRLACWMIGGGLIGAALPTPSQLQYVMPLLPPLGLALGFMLDDARAWPRRARPVLIASLCLSAVPGLLPATRHVIAMAGHGSPILAASDHARWAGAQVRRLTGDDEIVTLSPQQLVDSGLNIDRRFAPGPFVYRTGWTMEGAEARRIHAMIPATLADLDRDPPEAILVGYEMGTRKLPLRPDDSLIAYAKRRAYRMLAMPDGVGKLYVRPSRR